MIVRRLLAVGLVILAISFAPGARAMTLEWIRSSDALTLDPHVVRDNPTVTLLRQVYEPLVAVDNSGKTEPGLALAWWRTENAYVWEFEIRKGVIFHDGSAMRMADVVYSINRARKPGSDFAAVLTTLVDVRAIDDRRLRVETHTPDPLLPIRLSTIAIMSEPWAKATNLVDPVAFTESSDAVAIANGTGPFRVISREKNRETRLARHQNWWAAKHAPSPVLEINYRVISDPATRVAALASDRAVFLQDVPAAATRKIVEEKLARLEAGADHRVFFLGLNMSNSPPRGAGQSAPAVNPLADIRVRRAIALAIDRDKIRAETLGGQALTTGVIAPPSVEGYPRELDRVQPPDTAAAMKLLADAGYPDGFSLEIDCAHDRFLDGETICQQVANNIAKIKITLKPRNQTISSLASLISTRTSPMYLFGWTSTIFDSTDVLFNLALSTARWNGTGFDDPDFDRVLVDALHTTDRELRRVMIQDLWRKLDRAQVYVPLVIPTLIYATTRGVEVPIDITNSPRLIHAKVAAN